MDWSFMGPLKTAFHIHTDYSFDSDNSVEHLIESARQHQFQCLIITDHDTIEGAKSLAAKAGSDLKIVVGQEITTNKGHLVGLFLQEAIEPDMTPRETAEAIKQQGGLVVLPHPFNTFMGCGLRRAVFDVIDLIDIVEVFNAQNLLSIPNERARLFARRFSLPGLVGVDSHHRDSLNVCYQYLPDFNSPASFMASVWKSNTVLGRHSFSYFAQSVMMMFNSKWFGRPYPPGYGLHSHSKPAPLVVTAPVSARH